MPHGWNSDAKILGYVAEANLGCFWLGSVAGTAKGIVTCERVGRTLLIYLGTGRALNGIILNGKMCRRDLARLHTGQT